MQQVKVIREKARDAVQGHPWIYTGAIEGNVKLKVGELCEVYDKNQFLGIAYYDNRTNIILRFLTRNRENIDTEFFKKRFAKIKSQKEPYVKNTNAYRLVFGESDSLPGLIVDNYDGTLVMQLHNSGIETLKRFIVPALIDVFQPKCLYNKFVKKLAKGSNKKVGESEVLHGEFQHEVEINENGFKFLVNIRDGQKTGFFLDQRNNRKSVIDFSEGKKVLNCFSYTGGFSVYAASNAESVASIDISGGAIEYARKNFELNGFTSPKHQFIKKDVFDYIKNMDQGQYDMIILDPPSMANNKKQIPQAIKAYTTLNAKALEKLPSNGILVSASCTAKMDDKTFLDMLTSSAAMTGSQVKVLYSATQPADHAFKLSFPEGRYLKFYVLLKE